MNSNASYIPINTNDFNNSSQPRQKDKKFQRCFSLVVFLTVVLIIAGVVIYFVKFHGRANDVEDPLKSKSCDTSPCKNGGICSSDNSSIILCECLDGFEGDRCEESPENPCEPNPCKNDGNCLVNNSSKFNCNCVDDFEGTFCENKSKNPCEPNPCENDGKCSVSDKSNFTCNCIDDFHGTFCEDELKDPCEPNPCENDGKCSVNGKSNFTCNCTDYFLGTFCEDELKDPCEPNPCENDGKCSVNGKSNFTCNCTDDFLGTFCEDELKDPCEPNPCENDGKCSVNDKSNFTCNCTDDFQGTVCEDKLENLCEPNPCGNGGSCSVKNSSNFICYCIYGFQGTVCENKPKNPCEPNPCQNGGNCSANSWSELACECIDDFHGTFCENKTDCPKFYEGKDCDELKEDVVLAETELGKVYGTVITSTTGKKVEQYLGVPFAKAPIGNLRFENPEALDKFPEDIVDATDMKSSCWGYIDNNFGDFHGSDMWNPKNPMNEDCLYMNIWVPESEEQNLAVMVWIFGGGFYSGSNSLFLYNGSTLASHGNVIVVGINYRVGALGFLSTGDGRVKGNFGLKDQQLALKWINENIESFGGSSDQITLFGESAGAASVGYHFLLSDSKELFHRGIFQSGTPDAPWAFMSQKLAQERSKTFFESLNCENNADVMECLKLKPVGDISINEWVTTNFMEFPWAPTIETDFLTDTPAKMIKNGNFDHEKDAIIGYNKDEGTFWLVYSIPGLSKDDESLLNQKQYLAGVDMIGWFLNAKEKKKLLKKYAHDNTNEKLNRDILDDICGDHSFICPSIRLTDTLSAAGASVYSYNLRYIASNEVWPSWMGVIHGADIQWIFGLPLNDEYGYNENEKELSKKLMLHWSNFAKTGDPNSGSMEDVLYRWSPYEKVFPFIPSYLKIDEYGIILEENDSLARSELCSRFWWNIGK